MGPRQILDFWLGVWSLGFRELANAAAATKRVLKMLAQALLIAVFQQKPGFQEETLFVYWGGGGAYLTLPGEVSDSMKGLFTTTQILDPKLL